VTIVIIESLTASLRLNVGQSGHNLLQFATCQRQRTTMRIEAVVAIPDPWSSPVIRLCRISFNRH